jgi:hypothetical protein
MGARGMCAAQEMRYRYGELILRTRRSQDLQLQLDLKFDRAELSKSSIQLSVVALRDACAAAQSGTLSADRPLRPRRGTVDTEFWQVLKARRKRRDPQRRRVYAWERETVGHLDHEPLLGEAADRKITQRGARQAALMYLTQLWTRYGECFTPYYRGVPYLRVGFATARGRSRPRRRAGYGAYAVPLRHEIYCRLGSLRRTTIVHEVCHLFAWEEGHGPAFCAALIRLWEQEFGIDPGRALSLATRLEVAVDRSMLGA